MINTLNCIVFKYEYYEKKGETEMMRRIEKTREGRCCSTCMCCGMSFCCISKCIEKEVDRV